MRVKVKLLRLRGIRRADRDISQDEGIVGELVMHTVGSTPQLLLHSGEGSRMEPIIPLLFDARIAAMHNDKMMFEGIDRSEKAWYAQTWSVMVLHRS